LHRSPAHRIANGPAIVGRAHVPILDENPGEDPTRRVSDFVRNPVTGTFRRLEQLADLLKIAKFT
jgi:hypothetical protein